MLLGYLHTKYNGFGFEAISISFLTLARLSFYVDLPQIKWVLSELIISTKLIKLR